MWSGKTNNQLISAFKPWLIRIKGTRVGQEDIPDTITPRPAAWTADTSLKNIPWVKSSRYLWSKHGYTVALSHNRHWSCKFNSAMNGIASKSDDSVRPQLYAPSPQSLISFAVTVQRIEFGSFLKQSAQSCIVFLKMSFEEWKSILLVLRSINRLLCFSLSLALCLKQGTTSVQLGKCTVDQLQV